MEILTIRVPDQVLKEIETLVKRMRKLPTADEDSVTKADVTRIALRRGMELLEKEIGKAERAAKSKR